MARGVSFGKFNLPPVRPPISPAIQKVLTANPMTQAAAALKPQPAPKAPRVSLPSLPKQRSSKRNPFFGE
jgi:hypothetical protein